MDDHKKSNVFFQQLFEYFLETDPGRLKMKQVLKMKNSTKFPFNESKKDLNFIGSGSYADVFRSNGNILKMIRLLPEEVYSRIQCSSIARTTRYLDAYNEYQISYALSKLQHKSFNIKQRIFRCQIFPQILCAHLIMDNISENVKNLRSWDKFDCYSDIFDDYFLTIPKENLVIVMEDCGKLLADLIDQLSAKTLLSILKQIIIGMMIAEIALQFEHRDLHSGNIMLQKTDQTSIQFRYANKIITIPSNGYRVKIIDTTFSRLKYKNRVYFKDMTSLFENFEEKKLQQKNQDSNQIKMQDMIYEQMAKVINNDWNGFYPKTNLLWIKYVIYKLKKSLSNIIKNNNNNNRFEQQDQKKDAIRVQCILERYNRLMDKCSNLEQCFHLIMMDNISNNDNGGSGLNDLVLITCREI